VNDLPSPTQEVAVVSTLAGPHPVIYTIGHSNHTTEAFLALLTRHEIDLLVDVRSQPTSAYAYQFNEPQLRADASAAGLRYLFLGRQLGGRPIGDEFYDDEGHVRYDALAASPEFLAGIKRLQREAQERRVAMMCSEEDPAVCHRRLLVSRVLASLGMESLHIRADGQLNTEDDLIAEERRRKLGDQRTLFALEEVPPWRSLRSVLPKRRQPTFSTD
jgi:uncharacterized protein (DUF488 family)